MNIKSHRPLRNHFHLIKENAKQAKIYLDQGKISKEDLKSLLDADPTKQKKYIGWMAKIWIAEKPDIDDLRNTIEEYDTFLNKGKIKTRDINQFKSFKDLKFEVDEINQSGDALSLKNLENDYEIIRDDSLLIAVPHTHEASRKLGLSKFAFRDCKNGEKDSAWCTTFKAPDHFNGYYHKDNLTFYYIRVKSDELVQKLKDAFPGKYKQLEVVALAILEDGKIKGWDGNDKQMSEKEIETYKNSIGIS
jgi:hypothetical protein